MKQVVLREGKAILEEVPVPVAEPGRVLVRTSHSVLSAGTERAALHSGADAATLLGQATDPGKIRRALEVLRDEGPGGVLARLRARGEAEPVAPGYSASGVVQGVGRGVSDLPPGSRVACAGAGYASHAEWIAVPRNLVAPVPDDVALEEAAFGTLGAIALQGVRRSAVQVGECAVVLGLGLIGTLGAQILRAAGARVLAFDTDPTRAARGRALGFEAYDLAARDPRQEVPRATGGLLADAVLIFAASHGSEVVNLAMRLCRRKGKLVVIGDVGLDLDRSLLYEKELDFLISTSYGPGRYDPLYEEKGIDYPAAYVRWTENRNLSAFLGLIAARRVDVRPLIDRVFALQEAPAAYEAIDREGPEGRPLGVLLRYPAAPESPGLPADVTPPNGPRRGTTAGAPGARPSGAPGTADHPAASAPEFDPLPAGTHEIGLGLCGAGAFVKSVHLPELRKMKRFALRAVATASPLNARETARRFGISKVSTGLAEILDDPSVDLVLIGTRHHLHAGQAEAALRAGKHVFLEKPLCLVEEEVAPLLLEARRRRRLLAVGFNRRYSPLALRAREVLRRLPGPALALYRVNAGRLPAGHWTQDRSQGGGRVLGECCHFLDLLLALVGAPISAIEARALPTDGATVVASDSFAALLSFADGSRATLLYTGLGDPGLAKERLEIFKG
ncbi:MAG TPA: Gfo/Idh/MocA family oxidoreductase, partial [Candidatus Polarisedimenticolia bacterium]|nr:Gfo/Idh/MocA family oxidoreductase [Candidatus Polarisedimenticolia bacterium]